MDVWDKNVAPEKREGFKFSVRGDHAIALGQPKTRLAAD